MSKCYALVLTAVVLVAPLQAGAQTKWFKYEGNPVLGFGPQGAWDQRGTYVSRVMFKDSLYCMWYTGLPSLGSPLVGHATSPDGVTWSRSSTNPVLSAGPAGSWDSFGVVNAYVIFQDSVYRMWYQSPSIPYRFGYATSSDGIQWTKDSANPIFGPASWFSAGEGPSIPCVIPDSGGKYSMWFAGPSNTSKIGYAQGSSPNTWTPLANPVFSGGGAAWSSGGIYGPRVLRSSQSGYEMWYGNGSMFGYATSPDGKIWTEYSGNPVFSAVQGAWDAGGMNIPNVLFDESLYHLWYSAGVIPTWRVGYAVSPKGFAVRVLPQRDTLDRTKDTVRVEVRVADPRGQQSYSVVIRSTPPGTTDTLKLFDDGLHGDSLALDGVFANRWVPGSQSQYTFSVKLKLYDTLAFSEMSNVATKHVVAVSNKEVTILRAYALEQNYPNPFNPSTRIGYRVSGVGFVSLKVYDILGRVVATLVNERKAPGKYEVLFDASGLGSGVYFYRLTAGDFVQSRKLMILK